MPRIVLQTRSTGRAWRRVLASASITTAVLVGMAQPAAAQDGPQHLPTITLGLGILNLKVEVAETPREHEIGLMYRTSMAANEGMLFVFDRPAQQCFWMKNTLIPLSVAFIADDGTVVNTDEMKAQTLDSHCSAKAVRYVLEMNAGWFKRHAVKAGDKLAGEPFGTPR